METRVGFFGDTMVSFEISHHPNVELDYLDIVIYPRTDTEFVCKATINGIRPEDIDELCSQLQSLKKNLRYGS